MCILRDEWIFYRLPLYFPGCTIDIEIRVSRLGFVSRWHNISQVQSIEWNKLSWIFLITLQFICLLIFIFIILLLSFLFNQCLWLSWFIFSVQMLLYTFCTVCNFQIMKNIYTKLNRQTILYYYRNYINKIVLSLSSLLHLFRFDFSFIDFSHFLSTNSHIHKCCILVRFVVSFSFRFLLHRFSNFLSDNVSFVEIEASAGILLLYFRLCVSIT